MHIVPWHRPRKDLGIGSRVARRAGEVLGAHSGARGVRGVGRRPTPWALPGAVGTRIRLGNVVVAVHVCELWNGVPHPALASALCDDGGADLEVHRGVLEADRVLAAHKLEGHPLETLLGQRLVRRAQTKLVPAAVARCLLPPRLRQGAHLPDRARRPRLEDLAAEIALPRETCRLVRTRVEDLDRISAGHPTSIKDRGRARCSPRVELEDIRHGSLFGVVVGRPILLAKGLPGRSLLWALVEVRIPDAVPGACFAANAAALREPEAALASIALGCAVCAHTRVWFDPARRWEMLVAPAGQFGIDRIARRRHDHGPMRGSRDGIE